MNKWEYGEIYKKYDMDGIINLPNNSKVKVCDLVLEMPDFMKEADILFIDPPCSQGNLTTFYTKANQQNLNSFNDFYNSLFKRIDEINPNLLFLEVFKSNVNLFLKECEKRYVYVTFYNSIYYNNKKNKCWIIQASNEKLYYPELENLDEEKIIKWICTNIDFNCIGDLCMGKGLVGKYAYLNNKKFVGTELNKKRLAILIDFIKNYDIKN
jgi:hypothetical protein